MKEKFIKVIKFTYGKVEVKRIENTLKSLQEQVEGYIECFEIPNHTIICNEEGKIMDLVPNLLIFANNRLIEVLCGNLIICNTDENGEFASLTNKEIENIINNKEIIKYRMIKI